MEASFLIIQITQDTVVAIQMYIFPSEEVSGIQSISKKKPEEELVLSQIA